MKKNRVFASLQPNQMTPTQLEHTSVTVSEVKYAASSSKSSF